jgi:F0F1-type ATP synthase membrane subunit c/vacuolar-type H+-ATPase subunit K
MLLADPPCVVSVGSGAVDDDPDVGLSGGEIGTDFVLAMAVEPWADDALFSGGFIGVALGADTVSSIAGGSTGGKSRDV